jgi:hypothetical protein
MGKILMFSKLTLKHAFEPKSIKVKDYWLSGLVIDEEGHLDIVQIVRPEGPRPTTLGVAAAKLHEGWKKLDGETKKTLLTPVWCLHETNPLIQGVKSLLVTDLVDTLSSQISSLKLEEPIEFVTRKVEKRRKELAKAIIDLTSQRMVILGDALVERRDVHKIIKIYSTDSLKPFSIAIRSPLLIEMLTAGCEWSSGGTQGQATETRYFLFLPLTKFSSMRFNAFSNDLSVLRRSSTFLIALPMVTRLRWK